MSTAKHRSIRKVLSVTKSVSQIGALTVSVVDVVWCAVLAETARTIKTDHIMVTSYVGGLKAQGIEGFHMSKAVSLNKKNPMASNFFTEGHGTRLDGRIAKARGIASRRYILQTPSLSKGVQGEVVYFNTRSGEGMLRCSALNAEFFVYACNVLGRKTWYPETACVNLIEGSVVTFDLADMGTHMTPTNVTGGVVDAEKWASLDQSKLAFKCDEQGKAVNGLF
jgi:hypothetical protein